MFLGLRTALAFLHYMYLWKMVLLMGLGCQGFNAYSGHSCIATLADIDWVLLSLRYRGTSWLRFLLCADFKVFW